uniref:Bicarbonate transporter-like transmembrane domain-containing protein n=1 Tax=Meloidogyne javanica TaxID=6303 RepID=A0A915N764_MELJA
MHVESLKQYVDCIVPGEPQKFLGVKEQRLTAVFAHALIGCSVFLTPLVKNVPVPVLTGIFFYMGVVSLLGQQFVQRLALLFMPVKYQPDYIWLRSVPIKRVHTFTCIQLLSIGSLLAMKYSSSMLSMMFPMMVKTI